MNKCKMDLLVGAGVCALSLAGFGDALAWKTGVSGSWSDPEMWNLNRIPARGDSVVISADGEYKVSLPSTDYAAEVTSFRVNISNNRSITIDGEGATWTMPAQSENFYSNEPWGINGNKGHFFNLETYNITDSQKHAVVKMTNVLIRCTGNGNDVRLDVDRGLVNFYDPAGVGYNHPFTVAAYQQSNVDIYVHEGSHLRLPVVNFRCNATGRNVFCFDGGEHEIEGTLSMPSGNFAPALVSTGDFIVTNTARVKVDSISLGGTVSGSVSSNRTFRVTAAGGGELTVGTLNHGKSSTATIAARDGGRLKWTGGGLLGDGANVTSRVEVVNGELEIGANTRWGSASPGACCELYVTNSRITQANSSMDLGHCRLTFKDSLNTLASFYPGYYGSTSLGTLGEAVFDGGTTTVNTVYCGLNTPGAMTIKGGAKFTSRGGHFIVAKDANTPGALTIEDEATDVNLAATSSDSLSVIIIGHAGEGVFNLKGGSVTLPEDGIFLGNEKGGKGTFNMSGGSFTTGGAEGVLVGHNGVGELNMSGGEITTRQVRLGWQGEADTPESVLKMTGGLLKAITTENNVGVNVSDSAGRKARLILDGGVLQSHRVRGWTGATAKNGGGWAVLEADGGTIRSHTASSGFVENFDVAELGPKGLTLESDFDVTVSQAFTNKEGENGRLILAGNGNKTLTAAASGESELVLADGQTTLAAAGTVSRAGTVTVTNNAVLALGSTVNELTAKGLTLGNEASGGTLAIAAEQRIVLKTLPRLANANIALTGDFARGTNVLIVAKGEADADLKHQWELAFVSSGRQQGMVYRFTAIYDEAEDETSFALTVANAQPIAVTGEWKGAGSLWSEAANWNGGVMPDGAAKAEFGLAGAPTQVDVDGDQSVAALVFNGNGNYTLGGTGSLRITDTGYADISVEAGRQTLNVPLAFAAMTDVNVNTNAALCLEKRIDRGGLVKEGAGALALSSLDNSFIMGVRVEDGLLTIPGAGALGQSGSANQTVLAGGTLEVSNEAPISLSVPMRVMAADNGVAALKVDGDVQTDDLSVQSGAFVKRGAGRLTVESETTLKLAASHGTCALNGNPPSGEIRFPASGLLPTSGYAGFNVVEGEVLLKGRNASSAFDILYASCIGVNTPDGTAEPELTVDGCRVTVGANSWHLLLGPNAGQNTFWSRPKLTVKNGGYLTVNTLNVGKTGSKYIEPQVELDNGTIYGSWCVNVSERGGIRAEYAIRNGSRLLSNTEVNWRGPAYLDFDNSTFAKNDALDLAAIVVAGSGQGEWRFRNGSRFRCSKVQHGSGNDIAFVFDDATWEPAVNDDFNFLFQNADHIAILSTGTRGLVLTPSAGREFRMAKAVTGTGNMTMAGEGTLRFVTQETIQSGVTNKMADLTLGVNTVSVSPYTLNIDGSLDIASGRVVVEAGAARTNTSFTGSGTLSAEGLAGPTLQLKVDDAFTAEKLLTLDGFSSTARVTVDLGRTTPLSRPFRPIVVAHYAGTAPDLANWRVAGTGCDDPLVGSFKAENGDVVMTLKDTGVVIFIR